MINIDRRHFLTSLAATSACGAVAPASASTSAGVSHIDGKGGEFSDWWFMAREGYLRSTMPIVATRSAAVDFWSMPYSDIDHAGHLPPEIPTGVLWYDYFAGRNLEVCEALDQFRTEYRFKRSNAAHSVGVYTDGTDMLSSSLQRMIQDDRPRPGEPRTALIALDSLGPSPREPIWARILPAFAQCYDRIIGHIHCPRRGLREWKSYLDAVFPKDDGSSDFEQSIWSAALRCDVVIVTSAALVETDLGLSTHASTEMLTGELMRRFGHAALDRDVLRGVLGAGENRTRRKPRLYAFGSATLTSPHHDIRDLDLILERQRKFVSGAFGDLVPNELPLFIATAAGHHWTDFLAGTDSQLLTGSQLSLEVAAPAYRVRRDTADGAGVLDLITLWPFQFTEA